MALGPIASVCTYKLFFSVHFLTGTLRTANLTFGGHSLTTYKSNMNGLSMHRKSLILEFLAHYFIAFHCEILSLFSDHRTRTVITHS